MKHLISCFRSNQLYFISIAILIDVVFILHLIFGERAFMLSLNNHHPVWLNIFFVNYTFMGDAIFAICLSLFISFYLKNRKLALQLLIAFACAELVVQVLKNILLSGVHKLYFESGQYLFFLDEQYPANTESMPSGHTAVAFAVITTIITYNRENKWTMPLLIAGLMMAFSRMYLAQHSIGEVLVGVLIGVLSGVLGYVILDSKASIKFRFGKLKRQRFKPSVHPSEWHPA